MSTNERVLTKRVAVLHLSETDDMDRLFPPAFGRIEIWADTLRVDGWIRLHGRDLNIRARCIEARPVAGRPAVLDVSGRPAQPEFDPQAPSPHLAGSPKARQGRQGQDGGAGQHGGRVSIIVDHVDGSLGVAANGSRGGHSERGGDGARPRPVHGVDGKFVPGKWPARGQHGGGVLQTAALFRKYVSWAAGQPGGDAREGGAAGAPGRPGDGGDGGRVEIRYTGADAPVLATIADGGAAGQAGLPANPGPPSAPGSGGRNRIYAYAIDGASNAFACTGTDRVVERFARMYKIPERAASGRKGAGPGKVPPQPAGVSGKPGTVSVEPVTIDAAGVNDYLEFLNLLLAHAEWDGTQEQRERALQRYDWLVRVTGPRAGQHAGVAAILRTAGEAMRGLDHRPSPPNANAKRGSRRTRA